MGHFPKAPLAVEWHRNLLEIDCEVLSQEARHNSATAKVVAPNRYADEKPKTVPNARTYDDSSEEVNPYLFGDNVFNDFLRMKITVRLDHTSDGQEIFKQDRK